MKIEYEFPDGRVFRFEKQPMSKEALERICGVLYAVIGAIAILAFFGIVSSALR